MHDKAETCGKMSGLSTPEGFAIDVLLTIYNKTWKNWIILSRHDQEALDILP